MELCAVPYTPIWKLYQTLLISECTGPKQRLARIYSSLQELACSSAVPVKEECQREFGTSLPDDIWQESLRKYCKCRLIQYEALHRLHYSGEKHHKIDPDCSPICVKSNFQQGNLLLCFLVCAPFNTRRVLGWYFQNPVRASGGQAWSKPNNYYFLNI